VFLAWDDPKTLGVLFCVVGVFAFDFGSFLLSEDMCCFCCSSSCFQLGVLEIQW